MSPVPSLAACLTEFNAIFGIPTPGHPTTAVAADTVALRVRLVAEERAEFVEALGLDDLGEVAKEAADLAYVVQGTADAFGVGGQVTVSGGPGAGVDAAVDQLLIAVHSRDMLSLAERAGAVLAALDAQVRPMGVNLDIAVRQVHASNLSKLDAAGRPIRDAGGKVLKGPDYQVADMAPALVGGTR